ncbi:MAG TPA: hypothetical protein PKE30_21245, partial [Niabella sp.]|nr:hypothetical protein [Niabella sp.]
KMFQSSCFRFINSLFFFLQHKKYIFYKFANFNMVWNSRLSEVCFLILFVTGSLLLHAQSGTGKQAFYAALASASMDAWNKQLENAKNLRGNDKAAFEGALLMRKSGALKVPAKKLSLFKQGHKLLEGAISKEPQNTEFRFLRLIIQENAPKIVGYNKNLAEDAQKVKSNYHSLPNALQQAISVYSKSSKVLTGL